MRYRHLALVREQADVGDLPKQFEGPQADAWVWILCLLHQLVGHHVPHLEGALHDLVAELVEDFAGELQSGWGCLGQTLGRGRLRCALGVLGVIRHDGGGRVPVFLRGLLHEAELGKHVRGAGGRTGLLYHVEPAGDVVLVRDRDVLFDVYVKHGAHLFGGRCRMIAVGVGFGQIEA